MPLQHHDGVPRDTIMMVEELKRIDYAGIESRAGDALLAISDLLPWDEQEGEHLLILQDKLNAHLTVIESGEHHIKLPKAVGRKIVIVAMGKFPLSEEEESFAGWPATP
jgi:hypothetical protein